MSAETVYVKTARGIEELEHRALGLSLITRRLLIQIDGRRTVAQLIHDNARSMDVSAALDELRAHGLIAEPGREETQTATPAPRFEDGGSVREALIAMAAAVLGDKHAGRIVTKLQSIPSEDVESLGEVVDSCVRLIRLTIDEAKAEDFRRQAGVILRSRV